MSSKIDIKYENCQNCKKQLIKTDEKYVHPSIFLGIICENCFTEISENEKNLKKVPMTLLKSKELDACPWCHIRCYGRCDSVFEEEQRILIVRYN